MLTFFMAPSSCTYCAFTSTFEALEVPYFCRETVLQFPGHRYTEEEAGLVPEEFVAEENINIPTYLRMCQSMRESTLMTTQ